MRPLTELREVRRLAQLRLAHPRAVQSTRDRIDPETTVVTVWCSEQHGRGRSRKLAEAAYLPPGFLVVSRIEWLASDQLNLRPWMREALLGSAWNLRHDTDDELLSHWLDHLDEWEQGLPATGDRWLKDAPTHVIATVLTPGRPAVYSPWVRCPDHPQEAHLLTIADLMEAIRRVSEKRGDLG